MKQTLPLLLAALILAATPSAQAGSGFAITSNVTVDTRSSVATLSGLVLSSGTLSPTFASATTTYTASVTNATTSITVTPTVTDATATIKVNGTTVASGTNSSSIPLAVGSNTISVVVTAQDGTTTNTYTVDVTRTLTLTIDALSNGSITGVATGGNYLTGTTATLTAVPAAGCVFSGWTGDASGTANPLSLLMNSNKMLGATFVPDTNDDDDDGLSNYDEIVTYGTDPALKDTDGDGLEDGWEAGLGRFSVIAGPFTWAQARTDAHARGGELACFPTAARWSRAMETLGVAAFDNYTGLWIGASDASTEGVWTWVNGEAFAFNQWATTRPVLTPGNTSDYAEVSGGYGGEIGKWYDTPGAATRDGYVFETGYATDPKVADADGDGLNDGAEQAAGSNPFMADTDGDGLTDGQEVNLTHTNPNLVDSNGNGINDALDDSDGDGLSNIEEITTYHTNPLMTDTDGDGLTDLAELGRNRFQLILGSFNWTEATADATARGGYLASFVTESTWNEGMAAIGANALDEVTGVWIGANDAVTEGSWRWPNGQPMSYNRWGPGQPDDAGGADTAEINGGFGLYPGFWVDTPAAARRDGYILEIGYVTDPTKPDSDGDGINDGAEITTGTNPIMADTDGDGYQDGAEVACGSNPLATVSVPVFQARTVSVPNAGTIQFSFPARQGWTYSVLDSIDLEHWDDLETNIIGQGAVITRSYATGDQTKRFFRVEKFD